MSAVPLTPSPSYTRIIADQLACKRTAEQDPALPDLARRFGLLRTGMPDNRPGLCCVAKLPPHTAPEMVPTFCIYMDQLIIQNSAPRRRWPPDTQTSTSEAVIVASDVGQQIC